MVAYKDAPMNTIAKLKDEINGVVAEIDMIYAPIMVVQGEKDDMVDVSGAQLIYDTVESTKKELHWFKESGHVITLDKERKEVNQAILTFLDSLDWQE